MRSPMAAHMAQLLADSDLEELEEIVERWLKDAPNDSQRHQYRKLGNSLLALKREFVSKNSTPSREDLEVALTMMMEFAARTKS